MGRWRDGEMGRWGDGVYHTYEVDASFLPRFPIPDSRFPIPDSRFKCKKPTLIRWVIPPNPP
ncbi:hypothetical protein [Moorena sp. SIO3H5]|uniref:hypothetical protein n=1 Tax=Moorena sp. SIO3H5 TaxID=2607834 RepID=UPI0013BAC84A|nr:hypothetical protein [Moorena sp. SIO3H5]NEO69581.1 hypothetical protein [Moorena sp. SIO3H5]